MGDWRRLVKQMRRSDFMVEVLKTIRLPPSTCPCGGPLVLRGGGEFWKLACLRCGEVAFEEVPERHDEMLPPAGVDDGEVE